MNLNSLTKYLMTYIITFGVGQKNDDALLVIQLEFG